MVDLHTVADEVAPEHREAITAAQDIVIAAVAKFEDDQATRTLDPAVVALRQHVSLRSREGDGAAAGEVRQ